MNILTFRKSHLERPIAIGEPAFKFAIEVAQDESLFFWGYVEGVLNGRNGIHLLDWQYFALIVHENSFLYANIVKTFECFNEHMES